MLVKLLSNINWIKNNQNQITIHKKNNFFLLDNETLHDPKISLDGGLNGLDFYIRIIEFLKVKDLKSKDSRAVYKNTNLDLRHYKKIKMYLHAESLPNKPSLPTGNTNQNLDESVVAFLRLGSDVDENYYQIEIPLKPTNVSSSSSILTAEDVWIPEFNSIDLDLQKLIDMKLKLISNKLKSFYHTVNFLEKKNINFQLKVILL